MHAKAPEYIRSKLRHPSVTRQTKNLFGDAARNVPFCLPFCLQSDSKVILDYCK